jgi:frataxin-like iron-binding protein CyaY
MNQKDNYWFDDKMLFIEGFEFDYALKKWMYKDSGNSMEFNMAFTEQVKKWFDEG